MDIIDDGLRPQYSSQKYRFDLKNFELKDYSPTSVSTVRIFGYDKGATGDVKTIIRFNDNSDADLWLSAEELDDLITVLRFIQETTIS